MYMTDLVLFLTRVPLETILHFVLEKRTLVYALCEGYICERVNSAEELIAWVSLREQELVNLAK